MEAIRDFLKKKRKTGWAILIPLTIYLIIERWFF